MLACAHTHKGHNVSTHKPTSTHERTHVSHVRPLPPTPKHSQTHTMALYAAWRKPAWTWRRRQSMYKSRMCVLFASGIVLSHTFTCTPSNSERDILDVARAVHASILGRIYSIIRSYVSICPRIGRPSLRQSWFQSIRSCRRLRMPTSNHTTTQSAPYRPYRTIWEAPMCGALLDTIYIYILYWHIIIMF